MYSKENFINDCMKLFGGTEGNRVEIPGPGEVLLYDQPLAGFASSSDEIFDVFKQPEVIGPNYIKPSEWLPEAETVVSFFFPFTERVRKSNRADKTDPSPEWLYGRIEGQAFITRYMDSLKQLLQSKGIKACVPSSDERFGIQYEPSETGGEADFHADSRWSERHAAYACGLGTFSLSRGLISQKGIAGRYASIIVSEKWEPTPRRYTGVYDYCIRCGACARNCPVQAISPEHGKNNIRCKAHLDRMKEKYAPRYGCGKCQVGVPCESEAPGLKPIL